HDEQESADQAVDETSNDAAGQAESAESAESDEEQPLARVRYGLGKELQLFPESLVILRREEFAADRFELTAIRRIILTPGDPNPSKLVLMLELDDGNTIIAAEGMSSVAEFRTLLSKLREIAPQIETDPPDMDTQLGQALDIRRRSLLGCYGTVAAACVLAYVLYLVLAYIGAHVGH
ncbi:MAG TPA: hypothetical protein VID72_09885, partial [Ktedonobacterales bacterium]